METHHQWVGDSHPAALAVALHVVFLVADVEHHFPGLWSLHVEVGATFLVYLREVVAGNGGLGKEGIGGNLEGPGHLKLRTLGLITQETGHGLAISATQFTVACGIEVQTVGTVRAAVGRDDLAGVDGLWQFVDLLVAADANTLSVGLYHATHIEVHLLGLEFQVAEQAVVDLLHFLSPLGVTGVRLALVHQDTLDHTVFLCLLGQFHESLIGIVVIGFQHPLHPVGSLVLHVVLNLVGHETFDFDATDGHVNHTDADIVGKRSHEGAAEVVGRGESGVRTAEWGSGLTPFAGFASTLCIINGGHQQEARSHALEILCLRTCIPLHVRLPEAEEDVEVGVYCCHPLDKGEDTEGRGK